MGLDLRRQRLRQHDWGGPALDRRTIVVWGSASDGDTIVWGTSDSGDTIVWGTSYQDPTCAPVIWQE